MQYSLIIRIFALVFVSLHILLINLTFNLVTEYFYAVPGYESIVVSPYASLLFGIVASIPSLFLPLKQKKPSSVILWIVYLVHIVPSVILFHKLVDVSLTKALVWTLLISALFTLITILNKSPTVKLPVVSISYGKFSVGLIATALIMIIVMIRSFGFNFDLPSIENVYNVRSEYKEHVTLLSAYVAIIGGYVISPLLILFAIKFFKYNPLRSTIMVILAMLLSLIIYANSGFKSVAFAGIVAGFGYMIFNRVNNVGIFLAVFIPLFILINVFLAWAFGLEIFLYHWIRRVFLLPGIITSYYYEFIIPSGIYHLKNSANVIAQTYFGTDGSANAGIIGDGIAKYRYVGLLFNVMLFVIILKISDSVTRQGNYSISGAVFSIQAYAISNSSLTTVMLSYGYFLVIICLYLSQSALKKLDILEHKIKKV